jgi:hypothetical protein
MKLNPSVAKASRLPKDRITIGISRFNGSIGLGSMTTWKWISEFKTQQRGFGCQARDETLFSVKDDSLSNYLCKKESYLRYRRYAEARKIRYKRQKLDYGLGPRGNERHLRPLSFLRRMHLRVCLHESGKILEQELTAQSARLHDDVASCRTGCFSR